MMQMQARLRGPATGVAQRAAAVRAILALLLTCVLGACGTQPTQPDQPGSDTSAALDEAAALLQRAETSQPPQRHELTLEAAELLHQQGKLGWAREVLAGLEEADLSDAQFIRYSLVYSAVALDDDAYFLAQRILSNPRLYQQWPQLSSAQRIPLRLRRADLFMLLGETLASIEERQQLHKLLQAGSEEDLRNQDNLWRSLMTLPTDRLTALSEESRDAELRGWFQLALISKDNQSNLERQLAQVGAWTAAHPEHPASLHLPSDLRLLQRLIDERPRQVALLLPQQGRLEKAGSAVRDGFMAAYYAASAQHGSVPRVRLYDSSEGDLLATYQRAVDEGAELVIGPLDKTNVARLGSLDELPVPTLAMNYLETSGEVTPGLFQFGLAIEDEARQAAERAFVEGHRYALVLATDADWGIRSAEAFSQHWQSLGGTLVQSRHYAAGESFAEVIADALHIGHSEERAKRLRGLLGRNLEFEPRRRQDLDMLFLVARPQEARQIKPTLAFHYAGEVPVYATSQVYSGSEDPKNDRDLNGIRFTTLPWHFARYSPEKQAIERELDLTPAYARLYALGVDAFYLYPRLPQLQQSPQARFHGLTGALQLEPGRRIQREQVWAQMRSGRPQPLPRMAAE